MHKVQRSVLSLSVIRVELRGAYMQDIPCRIPLPKAWLDAAKLAYSEMYDDNPADISYIMPSAPVFDVFRTLLQRSDQIASELQRDSDDVPVWVNIAIYSLLNSRPLQNVTSQGEVANASIEETCRLGLLLFLGAVWCMRGAAPTYTWTILEKLYEMSKMACIKETWHGELWRVQVWLFSIAALEVATIADAEKVQSHFVELLCGITEDYSNLLEISKSVLGGIPRLYEVGMSALCEDVSDMRNSVH